MLRFADRRAGVAVFERFTDSSRRLVVLAQEECRLLRDQAIRSEHLLLAMLREPDSEPGRVLGGFGVTLDRARDAVQQRLVTGGKPRGNAQGQIPFTRNGKHIMHLGSEEAALLGLQVVTPSLLLCGMLSLDECGAVAVLRALGVDLPPLVAAAERAALEWDPAADHAPAPPLATRGWTRAEAQPRRVPPGLRELARLLEEVAGERDRLERAVLRYGRHDDGCAGAAACTCGLQGLLDDIIVSGGDEEAPPTT
jgi:ATP-dependent Clp protease ATP-binding subunit ClpA